MLLSICIRLPATFLLALSHRRLSLGSLAFAITLGCGGLVGELPLLRELRCRHLLRGLGWEAIPEAARGARLHLSHLGLA